MTDMVAGDPPALVGDAALDWLRVLARQDVPANSIDPATGNILLRAGAVLLTRLPGPYRSQRKTGLLVPWARITPLGRRLIS